MKEEKIKCPICGCVCEINEVYNDLHFPGIYESIRVDFLSYKCNSCDESFTTTEMDELNLNRINKSIRGSKRKDKIKNIIK
jgi:hypothetical protein